MSSPLSFQSAQSSPSKEISSSPPSPTEEGISPPCYRAVKQLPFALREHCCIYFEEGLHTQALNLLISLVSSGAGSLTPALLPPPQHLAFAATLAVHPTLTSRAKSLDRLQASNLALRYLRLVLKLTGPINAKFKDAFTLSGIGTSSRRSGASRRRTTDENDPLKDDPDINSELATTGSLWWQAEDLWQVRPLPASLEMVEPLA
ncbi:MAG: hypothetical protein Q9191_005400 [Dirinaria sp. TL-2023a]